MLEIEKSSSEVIIHFVATDRHDDLDLQLSVKPTDKIISQRKRTCSNSFEESTNFKL